MRQRRAGTQEQGRSEPGHEPGGSPGKRTLTGGLGQRPSAAGAPGAAEPDPPRGPLELVRQAIPALTARVEGAIERANAIEQAIDDAGRTDAFFSLYLGDRALFDEVMGALRETEGEAWIEGVTARVQARTRRAVANIDVLVELARSHPGQYEAYMDCLRLIDQARHAQVSVDVATRLAAPPPGATAQPDATPSAPTGPLGDAEIADRIGEYSDEYEHMPVATPSGATEVSVPYYSPRNDSLSYQRAMVHRLLMSAAVEGRLREGDVPRDTIDVWAGDQREPISAWISDWVARVAEGDFGNDRAAEQLYRTAVDQVSTPVTAGDLERMGASSRVLTRHGLARDAEHGDLPRAGEDVLRGMGTPLEIQALLEEAIREGAIPANPTREDIEGWALRYGIGIDCGKFVNSVLRHLAEVQGVEVPRRGGGSGSWDDEPRVDRPDDLRPGDLLVWPESHIQIVERTEVIVDEDDGREYLIIHTRESGGMAAGAMEDYRCPNHAPDFAGLQQRRRRWEAPRRSEWRFHRPSTILRE